MVACLYTVTCHGKWMTSFSVSIVHHLHLFCLRRFAVVASPSGHLPHICVHAIGSGSHSPSGLHVVRWSGSILSYPYLHLNSATVPTFPGSVQFTISSFRLQLAKNGALDSIGGQNCSHSGTSPSQVPSRHTMTSLPTTLKLPIHLNWTFARFNTLRLTFKWTPGEYKYWANPFAGTFVIVQTPKFTSSRLFVVIVSMQSVSFRAHAPYGHFRKPGWHTKFMHKSCSSSEWSRQSDLPSQSFTNSIICSSLHFHSLGDASEIIFFIFMYFF